MLDFVLSTANQKVKIAFFSYRDREENNALILLKAEHAVDYIQQDILG